MIGNSFRDFSDFYSHHFELFANLATKCIPHLHRDMQTKSAFLPDWICDASSCTGKEEGGEEACPLTFRPRPLTGCDAGL